MPADTPLHVDLETIRRQCLAPSDPPVDAALPARALAFRRGLIALAQDDQAGLDQLAQAVRDAGILLQRDTVARCGALRQPAQAASAHYDNGGPFNKPLGELAGKLGEHLPPPEKDPSGKAKPVGLIAMFSNPHRKYFQDFEGAQGVIDRSLTLLWIHRDKMIEAMTRLAAEHQGYEQMAQRLQTQIVYLQMLDQQVVEFIDRDIETSDPRRDFFERSILFGLRRRLMDLQAVQNTCRHAGFVARALATFGTTAAQGIAQSHQDVISSLHVAVDAAQQSTGYRLKIGHPRPSTAPAPKGRARKVGMNDLRQAVETALQTIKATDEFLRLATTRVRQVWGEYEALLRTIESRTVQVSAGAATSPLNVG